MRKIVFWSLALILAGCARAPTWGGKTARVWLRDLKSADAQVRLDAVQALGRFDELPRDAVPVLTELLRAPDDRLREEAARTLGTMGMAAQAAIPELQKLLKDEKPQVRAAAADALQDIDARLFR